MSDGIHSCGYHCNRPECVKAQRDDLVERFVATPSTNTEEARDAARYRWLRDEASLEDLREHLCDATPQEMDEYIDAALSASQPATEEDDPVMTAAEIEAWWRNHEQKGKP